MSRTANSLLLLILFFPLISVAGGDTGAGVPLLPAYSRIYDPERDPFADGKTALRDARESGRRVLIELGGEWCVYCKRIDHFIDNNPAVKSALHDKFVVLKVNVSDVNDNKDFIEGLPEFHGYPHFFIAESDGTIVHSYDTTRLLYKGAYSQARFLDFLDNCGAGNDVPRAKQQYP